MDTDRVLAGRYQLGAVIGWGGMADVHHGRDLRLGRSAAIKVLHDALVRNPLSRSRFQRESQTVAGLDHPSIVSLYDTGEVGADGGWTLGVRAPYLVMEYVAGRTLRGLLERGGLTLEPIDPTPARGPLGARVQPSSRCAAEPTG